MPAPKTRWEQSVDRAMRSCARTFGEADPDTGLGTVVYTHLSGASFTFPAGVAIFESATEAVDLDTGANVMSYAPRLSAPLSAFLEQPAKGDTATIRGRGYRVIDPEYDGQGTVTLRLHENP